MKNDFRMLYKGRLIPRTNSQGYTESEGGKVWRGEDPRELFKMCMLHNRGISQQDGFSEKLYPTLTDVFDPNYKMWFNIGEDSDISDVVSRSEALGLSLEDVNSFVQKRLKHMIWVSK